jgi:hypothetical protein
VRPLCDNLEPDLLASSAETEFILKYEAEGSIYLNELDVRKPLVLCILKKKSGVEILRPREECEIIKPRLKSCTFKGISWLNGSIFVG